MRITKRQLKRIIREEYTRMQRRGLLRESAPMLDRDIVRDVQFALQRGGEQAGMDLLEDSGITEPDQVQAYMAEGWAEVARWAQYHESQAGSYATGRDSYRSLD
jgi:hypothetical protein